MTEEKNMQDDLFFPPVRTTSATSGSEYLSEATSMKNLGGRFLALWSTDHPDRFVCAAFSDAEGLRILRAPVAETSRTFPSITHLFPLASRPERTVRDFTGWTPEGLADTRPWLDHGFWKNAPAGERDYPFVRVEGEGVHEIPVGPVHAGIIEPGHFRFQVVGEKVLRMEERLGYTHKGIRALLRNRPVEDVARLSGRVSGDSAVAYQWALAQAMERATRTFPPERALYLRAVLLERERIANHLGDLGALGNDAGFGFGLVQFGRLKEDLLRNNDRVFAHRYLMDMVVPGGLRENPGKEDISILLEDVRRLQRDVQLLKIIYDEHGGLQDRFSGTGVLDPMLAGDWGLGGVVGRASGQMLDLRHDHPAWPYNRERIPVALSRRGDVGARVQVRFQEIRHSLAFLHTVLTLLPEGPVRTPLRECGSLAEGTGRIEGFRGEVLVWVCLEKGNIVADAYFHDPSWHLWPALERVVPGNLVADFPLINKSFNPSYSGHDL